MPAPPAKLIEVRDLIQAGLHARAIDVLQKLVQRHPDDANAQHAMAICLASTGEMARAEFFARKAAQLAPRDASSQSTCGSVLAQLGKNAESMAFFEKSLALAPDNPHAAVGLANALNALHRSSRAERLLRSSLGAHPNWMPLKLTLGATLQLLGRPEEGWSWLESAAREQPNFVPVQTARAYASNFVPGLSREETFAAHRAYGHALQASAPSPERVFENDRNPDRRLRVGVISADFRTHSVAFFLDALYEHLPSVAASSGGIEIASYCTAPVQDGVTAAFKRRSALWRVVAGQAEGEIAQRIIDDRVDVLIETSGHTMGHSMGVMHLRAAPVQASYCGYPNTTGVPAIDLRFVDSHTDPIAGTGSSAADEFHTERLVRLDPCFLCFSPSSEMRGVGVDARAASEPLAFGSFNATTKINDATIQLWSRVLTSVPGSTLVLKALALGDADLGESLLTRFQSRGVVRERITLLPPSKSQVEHLREYGRVDIGLDPFPYHGTTTTCDALFMGVPVVSRAGDRHASRVGVTLLNAVGLGELAATDDDGFVRAATSLAMDRARLASLRASLRERMLASALCDGPGFAARFAAALRGAWRAWCAAPR
ncbi:MAG: tetratricopeptide repeat protein [Planctomycetota bacterium]|nr:tetratricopeptide repeat protein [Planctomycetota bacterium]